MKDGTQHGPLLEGDLRRMALEGSLQPEDLVWSEGMASWLPASEVGVFEFPALPPPPPSPPPVPPHYVAPPSYQPAPPTFGGAGADIPNYLPWAIAATLFCCMPGGIVSIIFAVKANTAKNTGDLAAARSAANQAKIWLIVSVVGGLLVSMFVILASIAGNM
ncbi:MAG TPA: CD225/dispanin family protein [Thermoanaerobaculia bacterium]|nr:CD225/dispanin family protein [Thermoanaerobaculia bacterium]